MIKDFIILGVFLVASYIDIKHRIIPDYLNLFLVLIGLVFWQFYLWSAIFVFLFMFVVYKIGHKIFKQEALGFGDVKNFTAIGFLFGFHNFFYIFFYSFLFAGIYGLGKLGFQKYIQKKEQIDNTMPFIPFINLAIINFIFFPQLLG